jgi:cytoskeletal protein RodZ
MSLINDALKKAKQEQVKAPVRETAPQLRSPETDHPVRSGPSLVFPAIIVAVGLVGATFVWLAMRNHETTKDAPVAALDQAVPPPAPASAAPPVRESTSPAVSTAPTTPAPITPVANPHSAAPSVEQPVATAPPPVANPTAPPLNLNGIFYNPTRPTAIVNNKLVSIGSRVGQFTVLAITQSSISLVGGGQTNVLSLSE